MMRLSYSVALRVKSKSTDAGVGGLKAANGSNACKYIMKQLPVLVQISVQLCLMPHQFTVVNAPVQAVQRTSSCLPTRPRDGCSELGLLIDSQSRPSPLGFHPQRSADHVACYIRRSKLSLIAGDDLGQVHVNSMRLNSLMGQIAQLSKWCLIFSTGTPALACWSCLWRIDAELMAQMSP